MTAYSIYGKIKCFCVPLQNRTLSHIHNVSVAHPGVKDKSGVQKTVHAPVCFSSCFSAEIVHTDGVLPPFPLNPARIIADRLSIQKKAS